VVLHGRDADEPVEAPVEARGRAVAPGAAAGDSRLEEQSPELEHRAERHHGLERGEVEVHPVRGRCAGREVDGVARGQRRRLTGDEERLEAAELDRAARLRHPHRVDHPAGGGEGDLGGDVGGPGSREPEGADRQPGRRGVGLDEGPVAVEVGQIGQGATEAADAVHDHEVEGRLVGAAPVEERLEFVEAGELDEDLAPVERQRQQARRPGPQGDRRPGAPVPARRVDRGHDLGAEGAELARGRRDRGPVAELEDAQSPQEVRAVRAGGRRGAVGHGAAGSGTSVGW
jgi:hypothetical protein